MGIKETVTLYSLLVSTVAGGSYLLYQKIKRDPAKIGSSIVASSSEILKGAGNEFANQVNSSKTANAVNTSLAKDSIEKIDSDKSLRTATGLAVWDPDHYNKIKNAGNIESFAYWLDTQPKYKVAFKSHNERLRMYLFDEVNSKLQKAMRLGALVELGSRFETWLREWGKTAGGVEIRIPTSYSSWPYQASASAATQAQEQFAQTRTGTGETGVEAQTKRGVKTQYRA